MKIENHRLVLDNETNVPVRFSPNTGGRILEHKFIILHYTEGQSTRAAVEWLSNPASQVSAHLIIGRDGAVTQLVPFDTVAWHAGTSAWKGYTKLNRYSIGIELDNAGRMTRAGGKWVSGFGRVYPDDQVLTAVHKNGKRAYGWHRYTQKQIRATAKICKLLVKDYGIVELLGHDDIAPQRKWDPGPSFPLDQVRKWAFEEKKSSQRPKNAPNVHQSLLVEHSVAKTSVSEVLATYPDTSSARIETLEGPSLIGGRAKAETEICSVFISYSHRDVAFLDRLLVHLQPLKNRGLLEVWVDTKIKAGELWRIEIENALKLARVAILLISADFLASHFIVEYELPLLLAKAKKDGTRIIPVIVKPCGFSRDKNLSSFQAINSPTSPLIMLSEGKREKIYDKIAETVEKLMSK